MALTGPRAMPSAVAGSAGTAHSVGTAAGLPAMATGRALDPPIRSVLFGEARFESHGRSLALAHDVNVRGSRGAGFFPRLQDNLATLRRALSALEASAARGRHLSPAAHWLLDNASLLDEQLGTIRHALPRSYYSRLPVLRDEPLAGLPRVYGVAWAWVAHADSGFDVPLLQSYLRAYQSNRPLTLSELWALHTTLRVVLLENLRRLAERTAARNAARDAAHAWADAVMASGGATDGSGGGPPERSAAEPEPALLAALAQRGVSDTFLLTLRQRLDQPRLEDSPQHALGHWLDSQMSDPAAELTRLQNEAAEDQQSIRNAITTLRELERTDWQALVAQCSAVVAILARCPVHAAEHAATQDATLHAIENLARASGLAEPDVAHELLALTLTANAANAADDPRGAPAYWWRGDGENELRRRLQLRPRRLPRRGSPVFRHWVTPLYLCGVTLLTGLWLWAILQQADRAAPLWLLALTSVLAAGPVSEAVVAVVNRIISESVPPMRLARMAFAAGIGAEHRSLVVMPVMLSTPAALQALLAQLEQHALANPERYAQFALLSDCVDADAQFQPDDAALLLAAQEGVQALNLKHAAKHAAAPDGTDVPRFLLLHRERRFCDSEQRWIGWERKRGKLEELVRALVEPGYRPFVDLGALSRPALDTRHLVTLDADTQMPPGRLRALVGVAAHPMNQPRWDSGVGRIVGGYGILQPRVEAPLPSPDTATGYHALFNGHCGLDPYSAASSEVYQDLFGEGSFTGKGLLNVQAVHSALALRLPEGQVLSHDLLEGSLARCAALSEVTLVEDAPDHADVAASRLHRWTRGDWQLLPFLAGRRRLPLATIHRWKMLDNLRRSVVAPTALALLLVVVASAVLPIAWALGVVVAAFSAGPLIGAVAGLAPSRDDIALQRFYREAGADLLRALLLAVWHLVQLLQLALLYSDAITRAIWRMAVSRRGLLQWTTAAAAQAAASRKLAVLLRQHVRVPIAAAVLALVLVALAAWGVPVQVAAATTLLALWSLSGLWTWLVSRPRLRSHQASLDAASLDYVHDLARDNWRFYERHVGIEDQHLPPDNVQRLPHTMVAHRTSPTNIGLYLLAASCARELDFIGTLDLVDRLGATLDTVEGLAKHQGHLFNWYDTRTGAVLPPAYVSSVDSGNLAAFLLVVAQACEELALKPVPLQGSARVLRRARLRPHGLRALLGSIESLQAVAQLLEREPVWPAGTEETLRVQALVQAARGELDTLSLGRDGGMPDGPLWMLQDLVATLQSQLRDSVEGTAAATPRLHDLARRARKLAGAMDFKPLYDRQRRLLHIGLQTESQQLDRSHYDLLASEARLTSLVAIAKGDVPAEHWGALGRPFFGHGGRAALRSWSGSMFEYLMPSLVLQPPLGSALQQATASAVDEQRREALAHNTPWGISESAIAAQDHTLAYQYGPQGVARLALRRTPTDERVLAPYASALALLVAPAAAVANLRALEALGARRAYGFIEAIDYSPQRQTAGGTHTFVETHMAHHQAMTLVAACAVLTDGAPQGWARREPGLRAVASLLHERAPRETSVLRDPPPQQRVLRVFREPLVHASAPLHDALPPTHWLGNGRYALTLRSNGAGTSQWQGQGLTRWRDDLLRDDRGTFLYLRREVAGAGAVDETGGGAAADGAPGPRHSVTAHPAADAHATYSCRMQPDRVVFDCEWPDLLVRTAVWVSPEDDCELRQVELTNTGEVALTLTLSLATEPTLAPQRADEAHPAFSNLFIQASWDAAERALYLRRRPRLATEREVRAVHFLAQAHCEVFAVQPCADRLHWLGRYGSPAQPVGDGAPAWWPDNSEDLPDLEVVASPAPQSDVPPASQPAALPGRLLDTGMDPMVVISARIVVAPGATSRLTFVSAAAATQDELDALVDKYRQAHHIERASSMSHTMASILLHDTRLDAASWAAMLHLQTLLSAVPTRELPGDLVPADRCDKRLLWRHGIGGDRPILCVEINNETGLALVHLMVRVLIAWTAAGQGVDLVVVNGEPASYLTPVQHHLQLLLQRQTSADTDAASAARPVLRLLRAADLGDEERYTLYALARVRLQADGRSLAEQVQRWLGRQQRDQDARHRTGTWPVMLPWASAQSRSPAAPPNGRFAASDGRYDFLVNPNVHPARPWINVLANAGFGCHVSEMAGGHTWAGNSRLHQITRWANDPVSDPASEWLLLHDVTDGRVWPLGRALQGAGSRTVEHGIGFTRMRQQVAGLEVTLQWCVDAAQAVKQVELRLRSHSTQDTPWRVVALAEWMLGQTPADRLSIATVGLNLHADAVLPRDSVAVLATQLDASGGFGGATAWMAFRPSADPARKADEWTCDRREFHDNRGHLVVPTRLAQTAGRGLDPCAALARATVVPAMGEVVVTLLLGHLPARQGAAVPIAAALALDPEQRLARQRQVWRDIGQSVQVRTPDPAFDALVNHWLPYQTVACRLWARAGYYQAGGAFGFRDQLQDAMSVVSLAPGLLRSQLLASAARQFPEGDVQHWWHLPGGAGVRTHFSDDRLWLPYALAHYVRRTGEHALLDERIPFLQGRAVPADAEDIYETPTMDGEHATLYEHAARAIDRSLAVGVHGLPLIGTGDWNDGMNRVGHGGKGESVWLAWFLCAVVDGLVPLARERGESARAAHWQRARAGWVKALDSQAWDGGWYQRAFFDDGTPLGSAAQAECRIDLIAQAWAVLSGAGDAARASQALAAADRVLWDAEHGLLRLLHPPLQHAQPEAGYIQAYPPGVRENGGQYNHATTWGLMAAARLQQPARAWRLWMSVSPAHRWQDSKLGPVYGGEPYVVAGDICSAAPWQGRCGWSWYTGASGWLWRAGVESLCGLQLGPDSVRFDPCLPPHWEQVELQILHHGLSYRFMVCATSAALERAEAAPACLGRLPCRTDIPLLSLMKDGCYLIVVGSAAEAAAPASRSAHEEPSPEPEQRA